MKNALVSATERGHAIRIYDDGYGPLFVYGNEFGAVAIIRAMSWEDAYGIAEDEFMDSATWEDVLAAYPDAEDDENCDYSEAFGHRPNGPNGPDDEGLYAKSHYEWMHELTPAMAEFMDIAVVVADPEPEPEPPQRFHSFHLTRRPMSRRGHYVGAWSGRYGTKGSRTFVCHKRFLATHNVW